MSESTYRQKLHIDDSYDGYVWQHFTPTANRHPHVHDELEFNLIVRGECRYLVNGSCLDLAPYQLLWLFPDEPHVLVDTSADFQMWIALFRCERWKRLLRPTRYRGLLQRCPDQPQVRALDPGDAEWLQHFCGRLLAERESHDLVNAGSRYLLIESWQIFQRTDERTTGRPLHPAVFKASMLLRESADRFSLDQLADHAGLSPSRLSVLFSQQVGISITEYRNRQCFRRYESLRESTAHTNLMELAFEAGFGSYAQFHRVHRQLTGRSPRENSRGG